MPSESSRDFTTDDTANNAIATRTDIHHGFDEWAVGDAFPRDYIRVGVDILHGVSIEFILARFTWAIFPHVKAFMERGLDR